MLGLHSYSWWWRCRFVHVGRVRAGCVPMRICISLPAWSLFNILIVRVRRGCARCGRIRPWQRGCRSWLCQGRWLCLCRDGIFLWCRRLHCRCSSSQGIASCISRTPFCLVVEADVFFICFLVVLGEHEAVDDVLRPVGADVINVCFAAFFFYEGDHCIELGLGVLSRFLLFWFLFPYAP